MLVGALALAAGACSSQEDAGPPPATLEEERALAQAEEMIPPGEVPAIAPVTVRNARHDQ